MHLDFEMLMHLTEAGGRGFSILTISSRPQGNIGIPPVLPRFGFAICSGDYRHLVTSHEPYHADPVSVLDIQTGKVPLDAEGRSDWQRGEPQWTACVPDRYELIRDL